MQIRPLWVIPESEKVHVGCYSKFNKCKEGCFILKNNLYVTRAINYVIRGFWKHSISARLHRKFSAFIPPAPCHGLQETAAEGCSGRAALEAWTTLLHRGAKAARFCRACPRSTKPCQQHIFFLGQKCIFVFPDWRLQPRKGP